MARIIGIEEFKNYVGKELGLSEWHLITQEQINTFANATLDFQWIHTDVEKCAAESPYRSTIAHGFLTLSLAPALLDEIFQIRERTIGINYGLNNIRFAAPVPVNSRLRLRANLIEMNNRANIATLTVGLVFEIENNSKPACTAEYLVLIKK
jgi:acyl dehydratase